MAAREHHGHLPVTAGDTQLCFDNWCARCRGSQVVVALQLVALWARRGAVPWEGFGVIPDHPCSEATDVQQP